MCLKKFLGVNNTGELLKKLKLNPILIITITYTCICTDLACVHRTRTFLVSLATAILRAYSVITTTANSPYLFNKLLWKRCWTNLLVVKKWGISFYTSSVLIVAVHHHVEGTLWISHISHTALLQTYIPQSPIELLVSLNIGADR